MAADLRARGLAGLTAAPEGRVAVPSSEMEASQRNGLPTVEGLVHEDGPVADPSAGIELACPAG